MEGVSVAPTATRRDLQLARRLFHAANGVIVGTAYALFFTHAQVVHIFGTVACVVYILDRVRIHYPEILEHAPAVNRFFFRAEEQFRESAMTPYAIALLLTILTFPKPATLIAVFTLALADPLSAIVGIRWGRRHIVAAKSVEGSTAFLLVTLAVVTAVLHYAQVATLPQALLAGSIIGLAAAAFEMLPLRIDDNLTIPLVVGFVTWTTCALLGIPLA